MMMMMMMMMMMRWGRNYEEEFHPRCMDRVD
jgi:hypothetical protein